VTPSKPLTPTELDAAEFWDKHCVDCGHDLHPMNVCSQIVGGDQNGPDYCPCALDYPMLAAEYQRRRSLDATQAVEHPRDAYQRGFEDGRKSARSSSAPAELEVEALAEAMWFEGLIDDHGPEGAAAKEAAASLESAYRGMLKHRAARLTSSPENPA
jgi:hypothetical protein